VVENFADNMLRILSRRFSEDAMNLIFGSQGSGGLTDLVRTGLSFITGGAMGSPALSGIPAASTGASYIAEAWAAGVPGYQHGGDFPAGRPFIAGEHGYPELIVPQTAGTVIPAGQWGNTLSISVPVTIGPEHKRLAGIIQANVEREVRRTIKEYS